MAELAPGMVIAGHEARYTVLRPLGAGGFGLTSLARRDDGRTVVLKQLRLARMGEWKALELFEREAAVLAALDHPQVPRLHEFLALDGARALPTIAALAQAADGSLVIVQDHVEGESLQAWIDRGGRWSGAQAEVALRSLLALLDHLHTRHPPVVHRDIKPGNVILAADGTPHLVDFGAIQASARGDSELGSTTVGSFGFFPMEQVLGKARPASDLYALAMTMVVALTHRAPEQLPIDEASSKVLVASAAPHLPANLTRALDAMLEPAVGQRVASAADALRLLDGAAPSKDLSLRTGAAPTRRAPVVHPALWRAPLALGGGAALVIHAAMFDAFSESDLVALSFFWTPPIVFGLALRRGATDPAVRHPVRAALAWTGVGLTLLVVFFAAIFPAL